MEFDAAPGEMTFARMGIWDDKLYMVIVRGTVPELPEEERRRLSQMTNPTWPHVFVKLHCSFDEFISVFPCNHILGVPGDLVERLVAYCEIAGVEPVVLGEERARPIWERLG